jgi:hypothetical protein
MTTQDWSDYAESCALHDDTTARLVLLDYRHAERIADQLEYAARAS